jgi:hypothetical protein
MAAVVAPPSTIREWRDVDARTFREEIATRYEPAVLRGVVSGWPAVRQWLASEAGFCSYLAAMDTGFQVDVLRTPPSARGRLFYNEAMNGFNFTHDKGTLTSVLERAAKYVKMEHPPAVAAQSALIADCLPRFAAENVLPFVHESIRPRIWLGTQVVTPAHFDESGNVACVVAGRRRFTLLPPEQVANLYIGPLDFAPTGTPISLVSFRQPDYARFPRFREALAAARVAELDPGDAIYIPPLWWHHVESLGPLNALVNYWWKGRPDAPSAFGALHQAVKTFEHASPEQRAAWDAMFGHFVFRRPDR